LDLKVSIEASGLYTYPDAVVVGGADRPDVRDANAVTNPALVVEITSNSTEDYDRGAKLADSQQIDALQSVLIVSHCLVAVSPSSRAPRRAGCRATSTQAPRHSSRHSRSTRSAPPSAR
jgi:hypothetical protein